jgi:hypothetical protein
MRYRYAATAAVSIFEYKTHTHTQIVGWKILQQTVGQCQRGEGQSQNESLNTTVQQEQQEFVLVEGPKLLK